MPKYFELLKFNSFNSKLYDKPFSLRELEDSLHKAHDPGPDDIHYQINKNLPKTSLQTLLNIYNQIWEMGQYPPNWRDPIIIPIPKLKLGKDNTKPSIIVLLPLPVVFVKPWNK